MPACAETPLEVWHIRTETDVDILKKLNSLLSPAEQQRAQQTIKTEIRNTYITAHAVTRIILGQYVRQSPHSLSFEHNKDGKPTLAHAAAPHFNLSHTAAYSLLGLSSQCQIGIDIEIVKPQRDILSIAKRFFSDSEYHWLLNIDTQQRHEYFYQLWCHKEAYLKALGLGLQGGLSSFSLSRYDLNQSCSVNDGQHQWWIQKLKVPYQYRAALAVDCDNKTARIHDWKSEDYL